MELERWVKYLSIFEWILFGFWYLKMVRLCLESGMVLEINYI